MLDNFWIEPPEGKKPPVCSSLVPTAVPDPFWREVTINGFFCPALVNGCFFLIRILWQQENISKMGICSLLSSAHDHFLSNILLKRREPNSSSMVSNFPLEMWFCVLHPSWTGFWQLHNKFIIFLMENFLRPAVKVVLPLLVWFFSTLSWIT